MLISGAMPTTTPTPSVPRYILPVETPTAPPGSLEASRVVVGPLTTTFTPPASCSTPLLLGFDTDDNYPVNYKWGFNCENSVNTDCFPSSASANGIFYPTFPVYSPANACPYGWTSACGVSRMDPTRAIGDNHLTGWVTVGETLQVCCPNGWSCSFLLGSNFPTPDGFFNGALACATSYSQLQSTLDGLTCPGNTVNALSTVSFGSLASYSAFGFAQVVALVTGPTSTTTQPPETSPAQPSKGLSTGAKAGIGVGVAVGVLLSVILLTILLAKRARRHRSRHESLASETSAEFKAELEDKHLPKKQVFLAELEARSPIELDGSSQPVEMDQKKMERSERPPIEALGEMG